MTFLSWLLEIITGIITLVFMVLSYGDDANHVSVQNLSNLLCIFHFIVIPGSYLLNTEVNKSLIIAEGWCSGIRKAISPPAQNNQIVPDVEIEENNHEMGNSTEAGLIPRPIQSISGNIAAIANVKNHDIYADELEKLSECITKRAKLNMKKSKKYRNKNQFSLDIPVQSNGIASMGKENCDDIETIVLQEQVEQIRPRSAAKLSASRNNWI